MPWQLSDPEPTKWIFTCMNTLACVNTVCERKRELKRKVVSKRKREQEKVRGEVNTSLVREIKKGDKERTFGGTTNNPKRNKERMEGI